MGSLKPDGKRGAELGIECGGLGSGMEGQAFGKGRANGILNRIRYTESCV